MVTTNLIRKAFISTLLVCFCLAAAGQVRVSGTVYERSARFGLPGVSVMSTSGAGTVTDSLGRYSIRLMPEDSLSFSYQGKATMKFPLKEIHPNRPFDMSLHVDVQSLPMVEVTTKKLDYKLDSLKRREEYRKIFDYAPEVLAGGTNGVGVGINLDMLFSMRKIKRMEAFRQYLEQEEREKYIDYRFNRSLVKKLTGLESPLLDTFMRQYRPTFELLHSFENEYQYYEYIRDWGKYFSDTRNNTRL
ncbi:carboxypeptidase-like regulatory domain-containing protein [Chitinophaga nivalis]|uniref:Carboxypeptidase-like regulatory domain-containing protein n=1 Tax=Chitinophaga nivalis TaxID=2991709 RepID=A0ABT3IK04_9BACT|nr:carboxypeptidase-like regulatory domain-containing protein [Chitinophaga nivalis]MCW3466035.1 carboxypeptidase-like regulatory domain-containing protein [Chitinophaga nivalis]MCW3484274.1 carboxypeptidase-like regulatory domain-containing protein [Chitinophaga nivalis]